MNPMIANLKKNPSVDAQLSEFVNSEATKGGGCSPDDAVRKESPGKAFLDLPKDLIERVKSIAFEGDFKGSRDFFRFSTVNRAFAHRLQSNFSAGQNQSEAAPGSTGHVRPEMRVLVARLSDSPLGLDNVTIRDQHLSDADFEMLLSGFERSRSVRRICLEGLRLGNLRFKQLVNALSGLNTLEELSVAHNFLTQVALPDIVRLIDEHQQLSILTLNSNRLGDDGVKQIFRSLLKSQAIRNINLQYCGISSSGIAIAKALMNEMPVCPEVNFKFNDFV